MEAQCYSVSNAVCNGIMLDFYQELATYEKPTISRSGLNSAYALLPHNISPKYLVIEAHHVCVGYVL